MRILASLSLAAGLAFTTGCAAKQLRTDLASSQSELDATKAELAATNQKLSEVQTAAALAEARLAAYRELSEKLRAAFGDEGLEIVIRNGRMVVQLPNAILYDSGSRTLSASGKASLSKLAKVLKEERGRRFLITGHTDTVPVADTSKGFKNNWELSVLRATTAVEFLVAEGVAARQLGAAGHAQFLPDAKGQTDADKAQNRRLEIIVMPKTDEIPPMPEKL